MPNEKMKLSITSMTVDPRTILVWEDYRENSRRTKATIFQQMLIFCVRNNFNPLQAPMEWEEQE